MTVWRTALAACVAALLLTGCGGGGDDETTTTALPVGCASVSKPKPKQVQLSQPTTQLQGPTSATVETSCGTFKIALDVSRSPLTSASFASQARQGVYDDTLFHRIIPGFVVQGGDPTQTGSGGPGYFVDEPPPRGLSYTRGTVAMAKSPAEPPGRSGSQFFVVTKPDAGLTPDYALLGRISGGLDVVQRIESLGTSTGEPTAPVIIRRITIGSG